MNSLSKRASRPTRLFIILPVAVGIYTGSFGASGEETMPQQANLLASRDIAGPFIAEALQYNPGMEAFEKRYQVARQTITTAGTLPNPNLQLTQFVKSINTGSQQKELMLQQPLPWFGKLDRKRDAARAQSEALWYAYSIQQFKLVDQVTRQVFDIAFLDKSIAITRENSRLLRQLETIVEDRVRSGADLNDLLRLQVEIERFDDLAARQEAQRIGAASILGGLLGRNSSGPLRIDWSATLPVTNDLSQWLAAIPERSPQIAMLRALESSQEARERLARLENRPDLSVGVNYMRSGTERDSSSSGRGRDQWALMVGFSLPIWEKANKAVVLQASLEKDAISAEIKDQELQLLAEGRALIATLEDAQNRIRRYETKLLPLARQAKDITESAYRSGRASILDLIDSDRALLDLETEFWRAAADAWIARWKLATLSGGLWLN